MPEPTPTPTELREQYAAAIHKALRDYGEGDYDPGTGSDYGDQAAVVLAVRDTELQQLQALLGEAVGWIHEGELRERICAALDRRQS